MALILNIETATKVCSVALGKDGFLLASKQVNEENYSHAENLTPFIEDVLKENGTNLNELDAIAVSKGPGSYTGLRIGVSTAKGLAFGLNKPLIAVDTLKAIASGFQEKSKIEKGLIAPMIDARRMEVYSAIYDQGLDEVKKLSADVIDESSYAKLLAENKIFFCGDGAGKCKSIILSDNAIFINDVHASAVSMIGLSETAYIANDFVDVAYFEPYYLKDFIATTPKKLI